MFGIRNDRIKLVAMDLDGTLTQHKSKLGADCRHVLNKLSEHYNLLMVGAGSCERIYKQMGDYPVEIIGNYGMQLSAVKDNKFVLLRDDKVNVDKVNVTNRIEQLRSELGFELYVGQPVEFHSSGMITFPILGTMAPIEQKLLYDPDRKKRRNCLESVRQAFFDYTVFIGGSSSFDIVPPPYNKLYALEVYIKKNGILKNQVTFFGDDYGAGGNDEHIYLSDIQFIGIDDYRDFPKIAGTLL